MKTRSKFIRLLIMFVTASMFLAAPVLAEAAENPGPTPDNPEQQGENVQSVQEEVDSEVEKNAEARRKKIMEDAVAALTETRAALTALEEENSDEAIAALERATGKLELILARDPGLALAPTDISLTTHDLYALPQTVKLAVQQAEGYLEDGRVQDARALLDTLASEVVISVAHIPLATYPDAIKVIAPLIDDGMVDEAKRGLEAALNTLVVVDHVHPLPVMRADNLLSKAEELAETENRTEEQNEELNSLLRDARSQIEMAELLGYGDSGSFENFYDQIKEIDEKTEDGTSGKGFFDDVRKTLSDWKRSIVG